MQPDTTATAKHVFPPAVKVDGPTIEPAARWGDGLGEVTSAALSPDGRTVYFGVVGDAVRPELLLDAAAPYLAGLLGMLGLLVVVLGVRRVITRPQQTSKAYCRKCNYELTPASGASTVRDGAVCPECGVALAKRPPRRGRRKARRLLPPVALCIACGLLAAPLLIAPLWSGPAMRGVGLGLIDPPQWIRKLLSASVQQQAIGQSESLYSAPALGGTPKPLRTVFRSFTKIAVAPDGATLFAGEPSRGLHQYDAQTGRALQRAPMSGRFMVQVNGHNIIGFTPDGRGAYVQWTTQNRGPGATAEPCGVSIWNLDAGSVTDVLSTPTWKDPTTSFPDAGFFWLQSDQPDWRIIQTPNFMQAYAIKTWPVTAYTRDGSKELASIANIDPSVTPAQSREAGLIFATSAYGATLTAISVADGSVVGTLRPDSALSRFDDSLAFCESRQWLAVPESRHSIYIRDIRAKKWIAALSFPDDCYAPEMTFSADGTVLAVVFQRNAPANAAGTTAGGANFTHDLIVWDLRQLTKQPGTPSE